MEKITIDIILNKFDENKDKEIWLLQEIYEDEMLKCLDILLNEKKWKLSDFLTLVIGLLFWEHLMEERQKGNGEIKKNVEQAIKKLNTLYSKKFKVFQNCTHSSEIIGNPTPIRWLQLAEIYEVKINHKIHQKILLSYFNLNWKKAENGLERGITFNGEQAAALLTKEFGWSVSPKNILELCVNQFDYGFGAYLDFEKYCDWRKENFSILPVPVIEDAIKNGVIDDLYPYNYQGLIRLLKNNKQDIFSEFISGHTVKHVRDGGVIRIENNTPILCVQLSLSEFILGRSQLIAVKKQKELHIITNNDLLYREDELRIFVEQYKKQFCNPSDLTNEQLLSRPAIKKFYNSLTAHQWSKFFKDEGTNGLIKCKIIGETSYRDRYRQGGLHKWLIEHGHYTPKNLAKIFKDTHDVTSIGQFPDLYQE